MFPLGLARAEFSSMGKPQGTGTIQSYVPVVRKAGALVVTEDTRPQNYPGTQCCTPETLPNIMVSNPKRYVPDEGGRGTFS